MATARKRILKVLTLLTLFIFLTSFFLNYSHTMVATAWFPRQMVLELSDNFRRLVNYPHRPCTCARCIGQRKVSSWFDERFNRSLQPLLTAKNALLEEDTYSWWLVRAGAECGSGGEMWAAPACQTLRPKCAPGALPGAWRDSEYWSSVRSLVHAFSLCY